MTDRDLLNKILNAKRCDLWPECACNKTLEHWQRKLLTTSSPWEFEILSWAETSIYLALECVAAHCPNRKMKSYAQVQLLNSWWDRQRRGEELTEEFCERLRAMA